MTQMMWLLLLPLLAAATGCSLGVGEALPPMVVYTTPANGSGNVALSSKITAAFSKPMDATTINPGTFTLTQGGVQVPGIVTCSGKTATFTPTGNLLSNSLFIVTITGSAKDTSGAAIASLQVWTFMTIPVPTAGEFVLYYTYTTSPGTFTRSSSPLTLTNGANTVSQSFNPADGSVTLTIQNAPGYEDNGFYFSVGTLQFFTSMRLVAASGSGSFNANLYLDVDKNGEFFTWTSNVYSGLGPSDKYFTSSSAPVNDVLTIDSTTSFGGYTLPQLRAGALAGVSGSTPAAIWLGFSLGSGSQTTTIATITKN